MLLGAGHRRRSPTPRLDGVQHRLEEQARLSAETQVSHGEIDVHSLPLPDGTDKLTGRQSFVDHPNNVPARITIELLDEEVP